MLDKFAYLLNHNILLRTFCIMLVLYFILIVPAQKNPDLRVTVLKGVLIVFAFCCIWWAIGNYDVVLSMIKLL